MQQNLPLLKHAFQGVGNEHPIATPIKAYQNTQPRHVVKGDRAGPLFPLKDHWHASDVVLFSFSFPFLSLITCLVLAAYSLVFFRWKCLEAKYFMKIHAWKICWMKLDWLDQSPLAPHLQEGSLKRRCAGQGRVNASGHGSCWSALWELCWFRKRSNALVATGWSSSVLPVFDALQHCVNAKALMSTESNGPSLVQLPTRGQYIYAMQTQTIILSSQTDLFVWHHHVHFWM